MQSSSLAELNDPPFMEHRWGQRAACRVFVRLSAGMSMGVAGRLRDVSVSGAFIETGCKLPLFSRLELKVHPTDPAGREISVTASVVRTARDGVGVEWCDMPDGSVCAMLGCTTRCAATQSPFCARKR